MLQRVEVRTGDGLMSILMQLLTGTLPPKVALQQIHRRMLLQKDLLVENTRDQDILLLRQLKNIYNQQYGYKEQINKCLNLDQLRANVDGEVYNILVKLNEIKKRLKSQSRLCSHNERHTTQIIVEQFANLSNARNAPVVEVVYAPLKQTLRIPVDYVSCQVCSDEYICGHRLLFWLLKDNLDTYFATLNSFAVTTPMGTICSICGMILDFERVQMSKFRKPSAEELMHLTTKKNFLLCQRLVKTGIRFVQTRLFFDELALVIYTYDYIYPFVKSVLQEYKQTFEYRQRLVHSLTIAVAAFFTRLEDEQSVVFLVSRFYDVVSKQHLVVVPQDLFLQQIALIKHNEIFQSGIIAQKRDFSELIARIKYKPFLGAYLDAQDVFDVQGLVKHFG